MPVHGRHLDDPGRKSGGRFQGLCTEFRGRWSARVTSMGSTSDGPLGPRYLSGTVTLPTYEFMADGARFTLIRRAYTEELQRRAAAEACFATEAVALLSSGSIAELRKISVLADQSRSGAVESWLECWHVQTDAMRTWAEDRVFFAEVDPDAAVLVSASPSWDLEFPQPGVGLRERNETREEYLRRTEDWAKQLAEALWDVAERTGPVQGSEVPEGLRPLLPMYFITPSSKKRVEHPRTSLHSHCKWRTDQGKATDQPKTPLAV